MWFPNPTLRMPERGSWNLHWPGIRSSVEYSGNQIQSTQKRASVSRLMVQPYSCLAVLAVIFWTEFALPLTAPSAGAPQAAFHPRMRAIVRDHHVWARRNICETMIVKPQGPRSWREHRPGYGKRALLSAFQLQDNEATPALQCVYAIRDLHLWVSAFHYVTI